MGFESPKLAIGYMEPEGLLSFLKGTWLLCGSVMGCLGDLLCKEYSFLGRYRKKVSWKSCLWSLSGLGFLLPRSGCQREQGVGVCPSGVQC